MLKEAVIGVASSIVFTPVSDVTDNFEITFGDTGVLLHKSTSIPDSFSWEFSMVKLNKDNRDLGEEMLQVINDTNFDAFTKNVLTLVKATDPAFAVGEAVGKFIFKIFATHLKNKKDKQLGILETSFIRELDYKSGNRDARNVKDETGNLRIDYTIFGMDK